MGSNAVSNLRLVGYFGDNASDFNNTSIFSRMQIDCILRAQREGSDHKRNAPEVVGRCVTHFADRNHSIAMEEE